MPTNAEYNAMALGYASVTNTRGERGTMPSSLEALKYWHAARRNTLGDAAYRALDGRTNIYEEGSLANRVFEAVAATEEAASQATSNDVFYAALVDERAARLKAFDDAYPDVGMGAPWWAFRSDALKGLQHEGTVPHDWTYPTTKQESSK